jgi:hypothetical protein
MDVDGLLFVLVLEDWLLKEVTLIITLKFNLMIVSFVKLRHCCIQIYISFEELQ